MEERYVKEFVQVEDPDGTAHAVRKRLGWDKWAVDPRPWEEVVASLRRWNENLRIETETRADGRLVRKVRAW